MREVVLTFAAPAEPLSMNDKDNRQTGRAKQEWRNTAHLRWIAEHPGVGPSGRAFPTPAVVHVTLPFTTQRRRDPLNWARTVKAIVDGLVRAGAFPDDSPEFVEQQIPTLVNGHLPVVVRVTEKEA